MIALVEGAERQKTPNELALSVLLAGLTIIFLIAVVTLWGFAAYSGTTVSVAVLVALLVTLIPTTIGGLLSAIGIAGMDRLVRFNVLATSGRAVEAAGDVDTLLLDKTGTITFGNRMASEFIALPGRRDPQAGRSRAGRQPWRRDAGRPLDRRPGQGAITVGRAGPFGGATIRPSFPSPPRPASPASISPGAAHPQGRGRMRCCASSA